MGFVEELRKSNQSDVLKMQRHGKIRDGLLLIRRKIKQKLEEERKKELMIAETFYKESTIHEQLLEFTNSDLSPKDFRIAKSNSKYGDKVILSAIWNDNAYGMTFTYNANGDIFTSSTSGFCVNIPYALWKENSDLQAKAILEAYKNPIDHRNFKH